MTVQGNMERGQLGNQSMEPPVQSPQPTPVLLSELRNQSLLVQCPYCSKHVYTETSSADMFDCIVIFSFVHWFFPVDIQYLEESLITATVWLLLWFMYTAHKCPSCSKKIASYNGIKRTVHITAPAIETVPLLA